MIPILSFICALLLTSLAYSINIIIIQKRKYKETLNKCDKKYEDLLKEYEKKLLNHIQEEKLRRLRDAASVTHHLSNIISGMNHELSPWIGGIKNKISRLASKNKSSVLSIDVLTSKLDDIYKACDSMNMILNNLSRDIKKVQKYNNFDSCLLDTVTSWIRLTITDRSIKEDISEDNFHIDKDSLNFSCNHAPMLLSQVVLNLVKNSIDHNNDMLDTLIIRIRGDPNTKCLIYEDNGRGIPDEQLESIFKPGLTTKEHDKELHGIGLSLCQDYCLTMGAVILAEDCAYGARFVIYFESDGEKALENTKIRKIKNERESSIRLACKLGDR